MNNYGLRTYDYGLMKGFFITLEGIDGCGKSTQTELLVAALQQRGFDVVATRQPGGTTIGQAIRAVIVNHHHNLAPMAELLLMMADRAQHVTEQIRPSLEAGRIVLSDRYIDSSMAFQGYGRGINLNAVDELNKLATGGLMPDLTILFDLDLEEARSRLNQRDDEALALTGFDEEKHDFHVRVRDGYYQLAEKYPSRIHIIDATGTVEEVHQRTLALVLNTLRTQ